MQNSRLAIWAAATAMVFASCADPSTSDDAELAGRIGASSTKQLRTGETRHQSRTHTSQLRLLRTSSSVQADLTTAIETTTGSAAERARSACSLASTVRRPDLPSRSWRIHALRATFSVAHGPISRRHLTQRPGLLSRCRIWQAGLIPYPRDGQCRLRLVR